MKNILVGKTILIVDDEKEIRDMVALEFQTLGARTFEASSGSEAIRVLSERKADAVITDIRMPEGTGIELLDQMKRTNPVAPVFVLVTGFADITDEKAMSKGAEAIFAKPFNLEELVTSVEAALTPMNLRWKTKHQGIQTNLNVELRLADFDSAALGRIVLLGRTGILVQFSGKAPRRGTRVSFSIRFDGGSVQAIEGQGIIRWVLPTACGVEFTELQDSVRDQIIALINSLNPVAAIPGW